MNLCLVYIGMGTKHNLLQHLRAIEPPADLEARILARIDAAQRRVAHSRMTALRFTAVASSAGVIFAFQYAFEGFARSGFYQYLSLLFSDNAIVFASWKEFAFSLVESVPILCVTILLSSLFVFFGAFMLAIKNTQVSPLVVA